MKKTNKKVAEVVEVTAPVAKEFAKVVDDKSYEANAFVVDYRSANERKARLAEMGRKVPESEKKSGEACVVIEGRFYWVTLKFGHVFKGTRLHVVYLKDEKGEICRRSITAVKPNNK
jgi:predicted nucleotide-binding protein (sugar kinase/HSP70/actin superfamily)